MDANWWTKQNSIHLFFSLPPPVTRNQNKPGEQEKNESKKAARSNCSKPKNIRSHQNSNDSKPSIPQVTATSRSLDYNSEDDFIIVQKRGNEISMAMESTGNT